MIYDGRTVEIVLPWVHLSFADPSTRTVVHDAPETAAIEGERSEGVRIAIAIDGALVETRRVAWPTWDEAPPTTERRKDGAAAFFAARADP